LQPPYPSLLPFPLSPLLRPPMPLSPFHWLPLIFGLLFQETTSLVGKGSSPVM
jgi:hypothetical protein